jgi:hypothetical protein
VTLALQIAIPIIALALYVATARIFSADHEDFRYFMLMPLGLIATVATFAGLVLLISWAY